MTTFNTVVELGCHYQDTVIDMPQSVNANIWVVDAVQEFLDILPNNKSLYKICAAVTPNFTGIKKMRGISLKTQKENNLPEWSTTMSTLLDDHPTIKKFNWEKYTTEFEVQCYSVEKIWSLYDLPKEPDFLSCDLEGLDFHICNKILDLKINPKIFRFESKIISKIKLEKLITKFVQLGYTIVPGSKLDYNNIPYNHWAYLGDKPDFDLS